MGTNLDKGVGEISESVSAVTDDFVSFVVEIAVVLDGVIADQVDVLEEVLSAAVLAFVQLAQHHVKVHRSLDHLKVVVNLLAKRQK